MWIKKRSEVLNTKINNGKRETEKEIKIDTHWCEHRLTEQWYCREILFSVSPSWISLVRYIMSSILSLEVLLRSLSLPRDRSS